MPNLKNVWTILKKDLARAPRSGMVFLVLAYPLVLTLIVQVLFGQVFEPRPQIGLLDKGASEVSVRLEKSLGVDVIRFIEADKMWSEVKLGNIDIGLVLGAHFDDEMRAQMSPASQGKASQDKVPEFKIHLSTQTAPQAFLKAEAVLGKAFMVLAPEIPLVLKRVRLGDKISKTWAERLLPLLVLLTFFMAGTFLTGFALVDEKMRGTLQAILATPTSLAEIILAKSIFSYGTAMIAGVMTLAVNGALSSISFSLFITLSIAAFMTIEFGIILGLLSKDISALYGAIKGFGMIVALSTAPYIWEGFPAWISKATPMWYLIKPIVEIVNENASLADVALDVGVAIGLCLLLLLALKAVANRTMRHLDV
ncbi:MAG: ABC transporter permease [Deltaproteobacteria bacterium]|nr:ABC transporter permease [Deltaproteobacteria bacterium]